MQLLKALLYRMGCGPGSAASSILSWTEQCADAMIYQAGNEHSLHGVHSSEQPVTQVAHVTGVRPDGEGRCSEGHRRHQAE